MNDVEIPDLPVSDDYFESNHLKSAVWQYLVDHAQKIDGEGFLTKFYVENQENFWWRIKRRKDGKFSRQDLFVFNQRMEKKQKVVKNLLKSQEENKKYQRWIQSVKDHGNFRQKLFLKTATKLDKFARKIRMAGLKNKWK